jgi:hypothetical protein
MPTQDRRHPHPVCDVRKSLSNAQLASGACHGTRLLSVDHDEQLVAIAIALPARVTSDR